MNTPVTTLKLKEKEVSEIKELQSNYQNTIVRLGNIEVQRMELDNEKIALKDKWIALQKLEKDLLSNLLNAYGEGNLSLADGTFTPISKP